MKKVILLLVLLALVLAGYLQIKYGYWKFLSCRLFSSDLSRETCVNHNASPEGSLASMRSQAGLGFDGGSYAADLCESKGKNQDGNLFTLRKAIEDTVGVNNVRCIQNAEAGQRPTGWAAVFNKAGSVWCADSGGFRNEVLTLDVISKVSGSTADVSCEN